VLFVQRTVSVYFWNSNKIISLVTVMFWRFCTEENIMYGVQNLPTLLFSLGPSLKPARLINNCPEIEPI
jgi:hypothetical protein